MEIFVDQLNYITIFNFFNFDLNINRLFGYLDIYLKAIHPMYFYLIFAIFISLLFNDVKNIIYKIFNLIILSILVILLWLIYAEVLFIFIAYILAFIGAIIMLFLSVILMLPASIIHRFTLNISGFFLSSITYENNPEKVKEFFSKPTAAEYIKQQRVEELNMYKNTLANVKKLVAEIKQNKKETLELKEKLELKKKFMNDDSLKRWLSERQSKKSWQELSWAEQEKLKDKFWKGADGKFKVSIKENYEIKLDNEYFKFYQKKQLSIFDRVYEFVSLKINFISDIFVKFIKANPEVANFLVGNYRDRFGNWWCSILWSFTYGFNSWNEFFWDGIIYKSGAKTIVEWFNLSIYNCIRDYVFWPIIFPIAFLLGFFWCLEKFNYNFFILNWFYYTPDTFNQFINIPVYKDVWLMPLSIEGHWTSTFVCMLKFTDCSNYNILNTTESFIILILFCFTLRYWKDFWWGYTFIESCVEFLDHYKPDFYLYFLKDALKISNFLSPQLATNKVDVIHSSTWWRYQDGMKYMSYNDFYYTKSAYAVDYSFILTDFKNNIWYITSICLILLVLNNYLKFIINIIWNHKLLLKAEYNINAFKLYSKFKSLETDITQYMYFVRDRNPCYFIGVGVGYSHLIAGQQITRRNNTIYDSLENINSVELEKGEDLDKTLNLEDYNDGTVAFYEKRKTYLVLDSKDLYFKKLKRRLKQKTDYNYTLFFYRLFSHRDFLFKNIYFKLVSYYTIKNITMIYGNAVNNISNEIKTASRMANIYFNLRTENKLVVNLNKNYKLTKIENLSNFNQDPLQIYNQLYTEKISTLKQVINEVQISKNKNSKPKNYTVWGDISNLLKKLDLKQKIQNYFKPIFAEFNEYNFFNKPINFGYILIYLNEVNDKTEQTTLNDETFITIIETSSFNEYILSWVLGLPLLSIVLFYFFSHIKIYGFTYYSRFVEYILHLIDVSKKKLAQFYLYFSIWCQTIYSIFYFLLFVPFKFVALHKEWKKSDVEGYIKQLEYFNELEALKQLLYTDFFMFSIIGVLVLLVALIGVAVLLREVVKDKQNEKE